MTSVLVIDDCAEFRKAIGRLLTSMGYLVREAENGRIGLRCYLSDPADIVLLDIFMPERDGLETVTDLLRYDPEVRVIAMTGGGAYHNFNPVEPILLMGARKILGKPIDAAVLQSAIEEVLSCCENCGSATP